MMGALTTTDSGGSRKGAAILAKMQEVGMYPSLLR